MSQEQDAASRESDSPLTALFAAYREAFPEPEPSANFTPRLWEKIEAREYYAYSFKRLSQAIITAAAAASLLMGIYLARPQPRSALSSNNTYLELLAAGQNHDNLADVEIVEAVHERGK